MMRENSLRNPWDIQAVLDLIEWTEKEQITGTFSHAKRATHWVALHDATENKQDHYCVGRSPDLANKRRIANSTIAPMRAMISVPQK